MLPMMLRARAVICCHRPLPPTRAFLRACGTRTSPESVKRNYGSFLCGFLFQAAPLLGRVRESPQRGRGPGTPSPPPTCSSNDRGEMLKPCSAAGKWEIFTSATSSLGLSRARGRVREAPRRTSPKQRKGDLQKWLRDRTGGEAAATSAAEPRGLADGLRSVGLTSQLRPTRRVAMAASRRLPVLAPLPRGCSGAGTPPASRRRWLWRS